MRLMFLSFFAIAIACTPMRKDEGSKPDSSASADVQQAQPEGDATQQPQGDVVQPPQDVTQPCSVWLRTNEAGQTELWVSSASLSDDGYVFQFGCMEAVCDLSEVPANSHPLGYFAVVPGGVDATWFLSGTGGYVYLGNCHFEGGVGWQETPEGGYISLP